MKKRKRLINMALAGFMGISVFVGIPTNTVCADDTVEIDAQTFPDGKFREYVSNNVDKDDNGKLSASEISACKEIECADSGISSLKGIEYFTSLETLNCCRNDIGMLDVSKNVSLKRLDCQFAGIGTLNVSGATMLETLFCNDNALGTLDVSKNTNLKSLYCSENSLGTLDISKNKNLTALDCQSNNLKTLDISENIYLEALYCQSNKLDALDVSKAKNLVMLHCYNNRLSELDVSKNVMLNWLTCQGNVLSTLDVSKNTALETLYCYSNGLDTLNISGATNLQLLLCQGNNLSTLDVSKNKNLMIVECHNNKLSVLDVSQNEKMEYLECHNNKLSRLDVSGATNLGTLRCYSNRLGSLDLSKNISLFLPYVENQKKNIECTNGEIALSDISPTFKAENIMNLKGAVLSGSKLINATGDTVTYAYKTEHKDVMMDVTLILITEEVQKAKAAAKKELEDVDVNAYSGKEKEEVEKIIEDAKKAIDEATTVEEVEAVKKEALDKIKEYKKKEDEKVSGVSLDIKDAVIETVESVTLKETVTPSTAKDKSVTWKSSNSNVATVDNKGKVTGLKQGVVKITVITNDGKKTATANVRVLFDDVKKGHTFYNPIYWAADNGVTYGVTGTNNFAPSSTVTRGQVIAFLYRMDGNPKTTGYKNLFKDVTSKSTFYNPILWGGKSQVVAGYPDGTFREKVTCTRGQIVAFIWRMAGKPEPATKKSPFMDVNTKDTFYKAILWAAEKGITVGYNDGTFRSGGNCTRGQMVAFLQRFAKQYPSKVKL